ncbi:membrane dipeptidase [Altericroceibacterium spongiae]|uniref:Membrane dipeptidase n=1 Tax=Altericroceibacterium spongiae TaxID=2320269 RepID=A0A420EJE4_9SPHN|nr:membrane dipeptidase [Altericroceibacterium spongiae]RKF20773.1 membrane dipeptidase [Altericroceibacterium spongiae]
MRQNPLFFLTLAPFLIGAGPALDPAKVHQEAVVLDTHFDTPANLGRPGWNITDRHDVEIDGDQVDVPRMNDGGVDGGFFAIYTPQGPRTVEGMRTARDNALVRAVQIREMVSAHPDIFRFVITPQEAREAVAAGRHFVFMSMENGSPFAENVSLLSSFQRLGVTMASPVHFRNNALADSATDTPEWHGLSPKGREFVKEANRLGILIDCSHASDETLRQVLALSDAPIILSHSGVRAVHDHPRNVSDEDLRALAAKGGVVQINAFNDYMIDQPKIPEPEREKAMRALMGEAMRKFDSMTEEERREFVTKRRKIDEKWPVPKANFSDLMEHINHAIEVAGIDHVGISGDFDGGGGVDGFNSVADYPRISEALLAEGHSSDDVRKVMGGNALRVLAEAQAAGDPALRAVIPDTH